MLQGPPDRKVECEDGDAVQQQHVQGLLRIAAAAAVTVAVDDHGRWDAPGQLLQPVVAALQLLPRLVGLRATQPSCLKQQQQPWGARTGQTTWQGASAWGTFQPAV